MKKPDAPICETGRTIPHKPLSKKPFARAGDLLSRLDRIASDSDRLVREVRRALPEAVAAHVCSAVIHDGTLLIHVDGPAWVTRLRCLGNPLPGISQRHDRIRIRVLPVSGRPPRKVVAPPGVPAAARRALESAAATMDDPDLRAALARLAAHVKR